MSRYLKVQDQLRQEPRTWLITGVAGFIGANLLDLLLDLGQTVVGLDNFATGHRRNLEDVLLRAGPKANRFRFIEGDIRDLRVCIDACAGVDIVLHQAALGSVPRSIADPITTNTTNISGFLNILVSARDAGVLRFVYAASSSTYGDHPALPKVEAVIGQPLSPYAVTKYVNELYAGVFQRVYGLQSIGLRYFNVFGRYQDLNGPYAAVIPRWIGSLLAGKPCFIHGDGETSRDFCYIDNVIQANLLAAMAIDEDPTGQVYNVACGERTTLNELFQIIRSGLAAYHPKLAEAQPSYRDFRPGDVRHSQADIKKIRRALGYEPLHSVTSGLPQALAWYVSDFERATGDRSPPAQVVFARPGAGEERPITVVAR